MSNFFVTPQVIARQALPFLASNLVMPGLVHNDFANDFAVGVGDTVRVRKPVVLQAQMFDPSSGTSAQDVNEGYVDVKLDKLATIDVEFTAIQSETSIDDLNRVFVQPAAIALAEQINTDGLALVKDVHNAIGTVGTTPDGLDDFANAARVLNEAKAPLTDRYGVWDPYANAEFQQLGDLVNAEKCGSTEALRAGSIGKVFGLENYMAQSVYKAPKATGAGTVLVDHTNGYAAGTKEIHVDGVTTALAANDLLKIGDYYYTVASVGTLSTADQDITLTMGLVKAVADNASVTIVTASSAATCNMVFHRNAFAFVTRPLSTPAGVESYTTSYNGLSLRVTRGYNMQYKKDMLSMDVLYGYKTINPELACRVLG